MKQKREALGQRYSWWLYLLPPTILSAITAVAYYPSLRYPFLFDDLPNITKSYEIRQFNPRGLWFACSRWIPRLLNQFTYRNWEFNPFAYRFIDLIIHLVSGVLIFTLVLLISKRVQKLRPHALLLATITSGLFLLHPVQTQTVTYITQIRLEGLVVLFSFSVILSFFLAATTSKTWLKTVLYVLSAVLTAFAAGTKEIIIVLPVLLGLIDWFFIAQGDIKAFAKRLPIHTLLAIILYRTHFGMGSPVNPAKSIKLDISLQNNRGNILTQTPIELITPLKYLVGQFRVMLHYITMFFWPLNLSFDYGWKIPPSFWTPSCFSSFLALMGILFSGLVSFIKNRTSIFSFCVAWFFTAVLPRSSIVPSTEFVCDYKTYLGSFGVLFLIAYILTSVIIFAKTALPALSRSKHAHIILPAFFFVALGFASQQRNIVWSSRLAFWGDVINKTEPHTAARVYNNYAVGLVNIGKEKQSIEFYEKAIQTDPTYAEPVINLALHYQVKKEYEKAFQLYQKAITMREAHPEMYNNLGIMHFERKAYDKAEACFKTAIKLRKHYSRAHVGLGQTYQHQNRFDQAIESYEKALQGDYQSLSFYYTHGSLCFERKKYNQAIKSLETVESLEKNHQKTRFMLATSYYYTHQYKKALPYYAVLQQQNPNDLSACYNYGQTLLHTNHHTLALEMFKKCRQHSSEKHLPHTPLHVAKCLHSIGQTEQAKKELVQFIQTAQAPILKKMGADLLREIGV
ncbi:tetratricopeptide repeat protein [Candidatus Dependentiae bacterium]|nr:tetratricopeptide repeat protein [Candidatus Dependentiae bacterium]